MNWNTQIQVLFWVSVAFSVIGTLLLPLFLIRIPPDYLARTTHSSDSTTVPPSGSGLLIRLARNILAVPFLVAGLVMLFTPGQGLLMLLVGLWVADFPGKRKLERRIVSIPTVLRVTNKIRAKAGVPPLSLEQNDEDMAEREAEFRDTSDSAR